jgi:hypothetical protein
VSLKVRAVLFNLEEIFVLKACVLLGRESIEETPYLSLSN